MSRWHLQSCIEPDVVVRNSVPSCRTCKAYPDLEGLIGQQKRLESESGQPWNVPKDEPIGEMNLFWPECVQYAGRQSQETTDHDEQQGVNKSQSEESSKPQHSSAEPSSSQGIGSPSFIYERPLTNNEFRLVCLSAVHHYPGVVHVTLETYPNDDCPEYETVSYAWGGEDDNSKQRHPVYVGEYWDVMLHTQNCWSLLAYLQPRRGIRLVWIDSLSINQEDHNEKVAQVGFMGKRYRNCARVVLYLGPDYVVSATTGPHPRRVPFHEMPEDTFQRLLRARYFRRIWVVQEIILAPAAIIPLDGIDYVVGGDTVAAHLRMGHDQQGDDGTTAAHLRMEHSQRCHSSQSPWIAQISTGGTIQHQAPSTQLLSAMQLTLGSESSDPRDRIFGILGLIHADTFSAANYDISTVHVAIGVFSHIILNLNRIEVLLGAPSLRNTEMGYPSWLPDWKFPITFAGTKYPNVRRLSLSQALQDLAHDVLLNTPNDRRSKRLEAIHMLLSGSEPDMRSLPTSYFCCGLECPDHQVLRIVINAYDNWRCGSFYSDAFDQRCSFAETHSQWWGSSLDGAVIPWHEGAYIGSSSGALSLHLTHLLQFNTQPEVIMMHPDICLLRIRSDASSQTSNLFLGTLPNPNVDIFNLDPGSKDLFVLPGTENRPSLLLFMKRQTGISDFKLLACCYCVDLFFMTSTPFEARDEQTSYTEEAMVSLHHKMQAVLRILNHRADVLYSEVGCYEPRRNTSIRPRLYRNGPKEGIHQSLFPPHRWPERVMLRVIQGLINQQDGKPGGFLERYVEYSKWVHNSNPELVEGYLEITANLQVSHHYSTESCNFRTWLRHWEEWEVEVQAGGWVRVVEILDRTDRRTLRQTLDSELRMRAPLCRLEQLLSSSVYYWMLRQFTPYSRKTGVDEYNIIGRGPKEEYRSEFSLDFPEEIREAFNVDLWTRLVTIV